MDVMRWIADGVGVRTGSWAGEMVVSWLVLRFLRGVWGGGGMVV